MIKKDFVILAIILIFAIIARTYKINTPLADLHSWRQADTAAVARNFARDGINLLRPTYDDLSSIETGHENPEGLRMVEFPIYNAIVAIFYRYFPVTSIEIYGRAISAIMSLVTIFGIYYIALKDKNRWAAIFAGLIFAIYPFFVFFSRVVLPEPTAVAMVTLSIVFLYKALESKKANLSLLLVSAVLFALSILVKPTTIFYGLTMGFLFLYKFRFNVFKIPKVYLFFLISFVPLILWRLYITQFPEGIPASAWLITNVNTFEGPKNIFFKPAFFRWIFMERIGIAIFGIYGTIFFVFGSICKTKKHISLSMLLSAVLYLFTFQGGNVQHEYYQTIILPALAIVSGVGIATLMEISDKYVNKLALYPVLIVTLILGSLFSFYRVKDYYIYPNDLPQIAELIRTFTLPTDRIVTDRSGDTTLLYLADRKGAPAVYKEVNELKNLGYSYLVTSNEGMKKNLRDKGYQILVENELYMIVKL